MDSGKTQTSILLTRNLSFGVPIVSSPATPDGVDIHTPHETITERMQGIQYLRVPWFGFESLVEIQRLCSLTLYK